MTIKDIEKTIYALLDEPFFPESLGDEDEFTRAHDDHDGDLTQTLDVILSPDSDVCIRTYHDRMLRFRNSFGGGQSLRVRNALLILAMAIKKDNEERPQE